jgi:hypothetical protein
MDSTAELQRIHDEDEDDVIDLWPTYHSHSRLPTLDLVLWTYYCGLIVDVDSNILPILMCSIEVGMEMTVASACGWG